MLGLRRLFGRRSTAAPVHPRDPALAVMLGGPATLSGVPVTWRTSRGVAAVYACVKVLSETFAVVPLHLYRRRNEVAEKAVDHPLYRLLHLRPNRWQTSYDFREMIAGHLILRGNAYARIVEDGAGRIVELVPLHPDRTRPFRVPSGGIAYWHQPEAGAREILLPREVLHLRGFTDDGLVGLSPLDEARETFGLGIAQQAYNAAMLGNQAAPRGGIKIPAAIDDEAHEALRESFAKRYTGPMAAGKPLILDAGMEWQQIGLTNVDLQFIEGRKLTDLDVCAIFRVPPHKVGILDRATFSNIEHQSIAFVTDTMLPLYTRAEQRMMVDLLSERDLADHYIRHAVDGLLRGDAKARNDAYHVGIQGGWLSVNDVRRLEELPPIEGGDVYLAPLNMAPRDKLLEVLMAGKGRMAPAQNGGT